MVPGEFKQHENLIVSGHTGDEFCPPDCVRPELEKILVFDETHRAGRATTAMCAPWMYSAFNAVRAGPRGLDRDRDLISGIF